MPSPAATSAAPQTRPSGSRRRSPNQTAGYISSRRRRARICSRSRAVRSLRAFSWVCSLRRAISRRSSSKAAVAVDRPGPGSGICFGIALHSSSLHRKPATGRMRERDTQAVEPTTPNCTRRSPVPSLPPRSRASRIGCAAPVQARRDRSTARATCSRERAATASPSATRQRSGVAPEHARPRSAITAA